MHTCYITGCDSVGSIIHNIMHRMGAQVHGLGTNEPTCTPLATPLSSASVIQNQLQTRRNTRWLESVVYFGIPNSLNQASFQFLLTIIRYLYCWSYVKDLLIQSHVHCSHIFKFEVPQCRGLKLYYWSSSGCNLSLAQPSWLWTGARSLLLWLQHAVDTLYNNMIYRRKIWLQKLESTKSIPTPSSCAGS